jgi:ketosteroid isomerase-like protein
MSAANVELVRGMCEAFARRDWHGGLEPLAADIEWDMSTYEDWIDPGVTRGTAAVQEFFRTFLGTWEEYEIEFERFFDAGDEVLVIVRDRGRGKASGALVERRWAQLWTVRDGKVVRFRPYAEPQAGLEAAGLAG